jgi:DNA-binding SARP family transcriptional activator/tetratricopeptide (TPR) repeat protein
MGSSAVSLPVRLQVLGELRAWRGGAPVHLGGAKQRAVLALLAIHAGSVVGREAIAEVLWGRQPPPTAAAMIQSHVSRLRALLGPQRHRGKCDVLLEVCGPGYRLSADRAEVDLARYCQLADAARAASRSADLAGACELFRQAAERWQGAPAADVELLGGHPAVTALIRQHAGLIVEYAESAAGLGWHDRVLPHLHALTDQDPLNERAHACLMIALAGVGRQSAALEVYGRLRQRLDEELGVEPGAGLMAAQQRVLRHEVVPAARPAGQAAPLADGGAPADRPVTTPCQLPAAPADFTGRDGPLRQLTEVLAAGRQRPGVAVAVISGPPGAGKTALMVRAGHTLRPGFPDGQLWAHLDGGSGRPRDPADVLGEFLRALGVAGAAIPASLDERAALYRSRLSDRRVLVVLDDAGSAGQVQPLLPGTPGCAVLVSSRRQLADVPGARLVPLSPLSPEEATDLLGRIAGTERIRAEPGAAGELAAGCGWLPLALRIAGAKLAARDSAPIAVVARAITDERSRLDALQVGDLSVRASLASGYRSLSEPARRAFRFLGLLGPCDVAEWVVAALLGGASASAVVGELCDRSMLMAVGADATGQLRFRLHDLLRDYAVAELAGEPETERQAALHRAQAGWLQLAALASTGLPWEPYLPAGVQQEIPAALPAETADTLTADPLAWFAAERLNLLAACQAACQEGRYHFAAQLATAQAAYQQIQDRHDDTEKLWKDILAAVSQAGDTVSAAHAQLRRGAALVEATHSAIALEPLDQSVQAFSHTRDSGSLAMALYWRATCLCDLGAYERARRDAQRGVTASQEAGNQQAVCMNLQKLSLALANLGAKEEALQVADRALALADELADHSYLKSTLQDVAYVCVLAGDHQRALSICERALRLPRTRDHLRLQGLAHGVMGDAYRGLGRHEDAIRLYSLALPIFRKDAYLRFEALCLLKLGYAYQALGLTASAVRDAERSLPLFRELGLAHYEERARQVLAECAAHPGSK